MLSAAGWSLKSIWSKENPPWTKKWAREAKGSEYGVFQT